MAKAITLNNQHTAEALKQEIKQTRDGRYRLRLQAIVLIKEGLTAQTIAKQLMIGRDTFFRWVKWYNEKGLEGIRDVSKGGRSDGNPKWDTALFTALFVELDKMEEFWSVPKMQAWIEKEYDVVIPQRTIQNHLKKHGYSFKSSRPNPYKGDEKLQKHFKKVVS
jgi:transposase